MIKKQSRTMTTRSARRVRVADIFCGCGGMSLGFERARLPVSVGFDRWLPALEVYRANFNHDGVECDIASKAALDAVGAYEPHIIAGGPPCQDFSSAGPNQPGSARSNLMGRFVDIVGELRPQMVVMENVPRSRLSSVFKQSCKRLKSMGYGLSIELLDASYYGVPQQRSRLFLVARQGESDGFLGEALRERQTVQPMTMRDYFGDSLGTDYYFRVPTNYSRRGVFSVDEPCVTIRGVDRPIPSGYPGHPDDSAPIGPKVRALTAIERAMVQTFPKDFKFFGTKTDINTMVGNAVPVNLARHVAGCVRSCLVGGSMERAESHRF